MVVKRALEGVVVNALVPLVCVWCMRQYEQGKQACSWNDETMLHCTTCTYTAVRRREAANFMVVSVLERRDRRKSELVDVASAV